MQELVNRPGWVSGNAMAFIISPLTTSYGNRSANSYSIPNKQPKLHINYTTATTTKYYSFNGQKIALRKNGVLYYLHADHPSASSGQAWTARH